MNNQRTKLTIKLLEQSLIKLLETKNIYQISIRELCDEAGINRSTFYRYFGSQFDLLALMEDEFVTNIKTFLADDIVNQKQSEIKIHMTNLLEYFKSNYDFTRLLLNNNVDPEFPNRLFQMPSIMSLIERSAKAQNLDKIGSYYRTFCVTGGFAIIKQWINDGCTLKAKDVAEMLTYFTSFK